MFFQKADDSNVHMLELKLLLIHYLCEEKNMKKIKRLGIISIIICGIIFSSVPAFAATIDTEVINEKESIHLDEAEPVETTVVPTVPSEEEPNQNQDHVDYVTIYSADEDDDITQLNPNLVVNPDFEIQKIETSAPIENEEILPDETLSEEELQEIGNEMLQNASINKIEKESDFSLNDETMSSRTTLASLPDIYLYDYSITAPYEKYPFPSHKDTQIHFIIENIGSATATLIYLDFYVNDIKITADRSLLLDPLEPNYYYEWDMPFKWSAGTNTVRFVVNEQRAMGETNYNNNSVSLTYKWKDYRDPSAIFIRTTDNSTTFKVNETKEFIFQIDNPGKADIDDLDVHVSVTNRDGKEEYILNDVVSIPGQHHMDYTFTTSANYHGNNSKMTLKVDKDKKITDDYNKNNNSTYKIFKILYDEEKAPFRWRDASKITVGICPSAGLIEGFWDVNTKWIKDALERWNGVSSKVRVEAYVVDTEEPDTDVTLTAKINNDDLNLLGVTRIYSSLYYLNSGKVEIEINVVGDYDEYSEDLGAHAATITHEMGHALGFDHTECSDYSIMAEAIHHPGYSKTITDHDAQNLRRLYGN